MGRNPDLTLDFQGLLRSALIGRASGPGTFHGLADAREGARWLYDRVVPVPPGVPHAVERYLMLAESALRLADIDHRAAAQEKLSFPLPAGDTPTPSGEADRLQGGFILLHPFARGTGKSLTVSQVEAFCRRLASRQVVLIGRRGEARLDLPDGVVDLLDVTSLSQLIWVIRRASCVISVDSGPSHLAAALGKPLVAIHTWSDPRRVGPYRRDAWVWKSGQLLPMERVSTQGEIFFRQPPAPLSTADINSICALATSLSDSCA